YDFNEFIICAGYKQHVIKEYFANYFFYKSDITFDFTNSKNEMTVHHTFYEPWKVTVADTGLNTMTGGRVKRIQEYVGNEPFMLTYGDGVSDVNIAELVKFHKSHGKMVTMSAYNSKQRFGVLDVDEKGHVREFREKTQGDGNQVNIGFMVCQPEIFDYIGGDSSSLESETLKRVAQDGQLMAYRHSGYWQCMDTLREKELLEELWTSGKAPWKVWE
ncbi:MAG: glucose-1-phosphate cytidylyltransferase, partial [Synergistaceae bacterium]|nr:glucose-1-phosphate cytidylyltransferase [Synergistaceae bacterium]